MVFPSTSNRPAGFRSPGLSPNTATTTSQSIMQVKDLLRSTRKDNTSTSGSTIDTSKFRLSPLRRSLDSNTGSTLQSSYRPRSILSSLVTPPLSPSRLSTSNRSKTLALFNDQPFVNHHSHHSSSSDTDDTDDQEENSYDESTDNGDKSSSEDMADSDDDDLDNYLDDSTITSIRLNNSSIETKLSRLRERFTDYSRGVLLQALHDNNGHFTKAMLQLATNGPPSVTPATKTVKRKRQIKALTSDDDSDSGDDDRPRRRRRAVRSTNNEQQLVKAAQAVAFFNTAKPQEIMDVTGCNLAQTEKLIHLRPFDHLQDLSGKLKAQAGLSVNYVKTYMDVMEGYSAVDEIIEQVEHIGGQLQPILNIWETIGLSTSPTTLKDEGGTHLVEVDNGEPGTVNTSSTIYKDAMEGYLSSQPAIVNPAFTLKSYQLVGVNWMLLLYRKGISGILADEMGLGKTAQVISFLGRLQELGESGPHMVVVPASTMNNWLREFERFCPTLNVRCYYGSQADRLIQQKEMMAERNDIHAVVTTYSMVSGNAEDHSFLRKLGCKSLILDEGHMIKNYTSARYGHLMRLKIPFRLLLTGTPLQNNLQELVSLLIFIMPGVFSGNEDEVHKIFKLKNSSTINNNSDSTPSKAAQLLSQQRIARAKKMMTPFVLRRRKQQVLVHLPKKIHHLEYCTMTPHQENLYTSLVSTWQNQYNNLALDNDDHVTKNNKRKLNNIVMQLRKAADHPLLFRHIYNDDKIKQMAKDIMKEDYYLDANEQFIYEDMEVMTDFELDRLSREFKTIEHHRLMNEEWMDAGKIRYLQQLLPEMKRQGNKVLIFSQFVMMLDILELVMETLGLTFTRLDGSTKVDERQDLIDNFNQDPDVTVFLLGTKAGGFGINLTSANVVVMYDMDFNPQNDKQAEDRAHRVGQTRNVNVYKLVSTHTIEDQILAMADIRLRLDSTVSGNDQEDPDISKMKSLIKSALLPL